MIAAPVFIGPVAVPGSFPMSSIPVIVANISMFVSTIIVPATPESQEELSAGVARRHPISTLIGRTRPISVDPDISTSREIPVAVHPVVTGARLRRALIGVIWHRRRRWSIDAFGITVVGRVRVDFSIALVARVLAVIAGLAVSILTVILPVTLIRSILLRILLRILWVLLLGERSGFQGSREHYNCDPIAFHLIFLLL